MGLAVKNNNPGNLKDPATGAFRTFKTPQEGYAALLNDLQAKQTGTSSTGLGPDSSLVDFASKYAPSNDSNDVGRYTANLANQLGVAPTAKLKELDLAKWAAAVAKNEDRDSIFGNQKIASPSVQETKTTTPTVPKQPFSTPLSNIETGNSQGNTDTAMGALKGGLQLIRDVSGVDTSPVVKGQLANAPEFAKAVEAEKQFLAPQNLAERKGAALSQIGAALVSPIPEAKAAVGVYKATKLPLEVLQAVSPRLTPKVASEAVKTAPKGIKGLIGTVPSKRTKEIAQVVEKVYNPSKTFSENSLNVRNAIAQKATELSDYLSQKSIPYVFRELQSDFKKIELPHFIKTSDAVVQKRAKSIINKFMEFAKENEGKLDGLLRARKQFDSWVESEYPRVFDESGNAINKLVSNIREASKNFIEKRAPESGIRKSLKEQSLLYDALDIFNEKAILGELTKAGEIGSTYLSRFAERHPTAVGLLKKGAGLVAAGAGLGAVTEAFRR